MTNSYIPITTKLLFIGWGAEDDDFAHNRLIKMGHSILRFSPEVSRYQSLYHVQSKGNIKNVEKFQSKIDADFHSDGLSSLQYEIISKKLMPLYTRITVDV